MNIHLPARLGTIPGTTLWVVGVQDSLAVALLRLPLDSIYVDIMKHIIVIYAKYHSQCFFFNIIWFNQLVVILRTYESPGP